MVRECEDLKKRASELEDQALKFIGEEEVIQTEIRRLQELVAQEERKLSGIRERLEAELEGFKDQLERARDSRENLVTRLAPALRSRYERIRRSKGDMAVVGLGQGACGGCGYQLPPQKIVEVQKKETVVFCEGCGRMLVWLGK